MQQVNNFGGRPAVFSGANEVECAGSVQDDSSACAPADLKVLNIPRNEQNQQPVPKQNIREREAASVSILLGGASAQCEEDEELKESISSIPHTLECAPHNQKIIDQKIQELIDEITEMTVGFHSDFAAFITGEKF